MKENKAFTLIELLAVIIILAIIALISTPIIINVVEDARKEGFKQTALGYYKAAEYVYDEMMMNGKTGNIQFTFEDGKQTSSNSNYKLEVKGEVPQGGLVYLTKEGYIAVSINNNKYCVYVDSNKEVTISEDINHCGYTPVPEGCYSIERTQMSDFTRGYLDGSEEWMAKEYNMLSYNIQKCPKKFNILILPNEVDGVKIEGIGKFANTMTGSISAQDVIMPSEIQIIDYNAFFTTPTGKKIYNVILPNNIVYIGRRSFNRQILTNIEIPHSVKAIGDSAFYGNQLTSVTIPEGVTSIGGSAFSNNKLKNLAIPNSMKSIGQSAFSGNEFKEVIIGDVDMTFTVGMFAETKIDKLVIGQGGNGNINIADNAFSYYKLVKNDLGLKTLVLGNSVKSIGSSAFSGNQLKSITIPDSIMSIEGHAFSDNQLTSVIIPDSVTSIGDSAFSNNQFPNASAIIIEGDATKFDSQWTSIGFPAK